MPLSKPHSTPSATGTKLAKRPSGDRARGLRTDYIGNFVYKDNELAYILTDQGRIVPRNDGFEYQYFIKDHLGNTRVVFNDEGEILQDKSYYPFGMRMDGLDYSATGLDPDNKNLYNGKEFQDDFGLDWYDYGARMYDAQLGRFPNVDPKAGEFPHLSPYNYASNNPITNVDLRGLQGVSANALRIVDENSNQTQSQAADRHLNTLTTALSYTDANDAVVLATSITRDKAVNIGGTQATSFDKGAAIAGSLIPFASGSAVKNLMKKGGAYKDLMIKMGKQERHHIPANSATNLSKGKGPSIVMDKVDHQKTASWGKSKAAKKYQKKQEKLVNEGKFKEAQKIDIDDLQTKFGNKYNQGVKEMLDYTEELFKNK